MTPLLLVREALAEHLAVLAALACVLGSLALCRVRDVRCYAVALCAAPTLLMIQLANAQALVLLLAAVSWRYQSGLATGASIAVKLIAWPLLVWLVAIRRERAATIGLVTAVCLVILPWAAIGFAGIGEYWDVLLANNDRWASETYSIGGSRLPAASAAAALITALCLLMTWRRGRAGDPAGSFAVAIGACLAFSPIVWSFTLSLLFVPIAARHRTLHPVWFAPLAFWPLENGVGVSPFERAWVAAVVVAVVVWLARPRPS